MTVSLTPIQSRAIAPARREMLQIGFSTILGLSLPRLLQATPQRQADSCIVIFLNGGPSHLDTWDMKPGAPAEVRGEFQPIASSLPGVMVCEHLPRLAKLMHHCTLVRSVHHGVNNAHAAAVYCALTGHDRGEKGGGARPTDHPAIGSVLGRHRPPTTAMVPYALLPYITKEGAGGPPQPGFFGGWLGRQYDPLLILRDPNAEDFNVPELGLWADVPASRLRVRRDLLQSLTAASRKDSAAEMDGYQRKAFSLLATPTMQRAFQMEEEPSKVRDTYGRNIYGQSLDFHRHVFWPRTRWKGANSPWIFATTVSNLSY